MAGMIILVEAWPRRIADGVAQVVRLAGGGSAAPYRYGGQRWRAGIAALPTIIAGLAFDGDNLGAGAIPQALEIAWASTNAADLTELASGYLWLDAAVSVRVGPEGALPPVVLTGKAVDASSADGQLKIILADPAAALRLAVLTDRFAGTGGIEGPQDWEGRIKSRAWGRLWNVEGAPIDPPNNIYCFSDPRRPIASIDTVRDSGAPAAALTTIAWQGTAEATWAALVAANAPQGGGVVAPSIACVKWWTEPAGTLTADLRGEIGTGYVETAPEIAARVVEARGGPAFAAGAIAAAKALRPAPCGVLVDRENDTVTAVLDDLLGGVSLIWRLNTTGTIDFRTWSWNAPVAAARSHSITRRNTFKPVKSRKLGYRANQTVMARGDIAGIVFASDISFADGSSLPAAFITYSNGDDAESLKPYEPKATAGAVIPDPSSYDPDDTYPGYIRDSDGNIRPPGELLNTALGLSRAGELTVELMPDADPVVLGQVTTDGLGAARDTALRKAERDLVAVAKAAQEAMLSASRFQEVLRDAGIYVDPATGKIKLHAIEEARQRISQAEVTLNGALASINLKASVTFVEFFVQEQVALAVIAPEQVADLEFLFFRQNTAEQAIEAIQAQIITKASAIELSQLGGRVTTAESKVSALEGQITQKVDNTTFGALDDRVSTAEQKIEAIPSASVIRQSVSASRLIDLELQANARRDLKAFLTGDVQKRELVAAIADARNEMGARISQNGDALAYVSQQLGVRIGQAEGRFRTETQALADDLRVVTQQLTTLNSTFTGQLGTLSGLVEDLDQAMADERQATAQRFETVESTLGGQGEDLEELGARVEDVERTSVELDGALQAGFSRQATVQRGADRDADAFIRDVLKGALSEDRRARDFNQQIGFVREEAFATLGEQERNLVQRISALGLQLGGLLADIRALDRIVSDANFTLVQSIDTLRLDTEVLVGGTNSRVDTVEGDVSNTIGRVDGLEGDLGNTIGRVDDVESGLAGVPLQISGAITAERVLWQKGDSILAGDLSTLSTTVGQNTATLTQFAESISGLQNRWGVRFDNNGRVTGFVLNGNDQQADANFLVDRFRLIDPTSGFVYFQATESGVKMSNVEVDTLKAGVVTASRINGAAMGESSFAYTEPAIQTSGSNWLTIAGVTMTPVHGRPVKLMFSALIRNISDANTTIKVRIVRDDGVVIYGESARRTGAHINITDEGVPVCIPILDTVAAGRPTTWFFEMAKVNEPGVICEASFRYAQAEELSRVNTQQANFQLGTGTSGGPGPGVPIINPPGGGNPLP